MHEGIHIGLPKMHGRFRHGLPKVHGWFFMDPPKWYIWWCLVSTQSSPMRFSQSGNSGDHCYYATKPTKQQNLFHNMKFVRLGFIMIWSILIGLEGQQNITFCHKWGRGSENYDFVSQGKWGVWRGWGDVFPPPPHFGWRNMWTALCASTKYT